MEGRVNKLDTTWRWKTSHFDRQNVLAKGPCQIWSWTTDAGLSHFTSTSKKSSSSLLTWS
jgi:hypothetical protein